MSIMQLHAEWGMCYVIFSSKGYGLLPASSQLGTKKDVVEITLSSYRYSYVYMQRETFRLKLSM